MKEKVKIYSVFDFEPTIEHHPETITNVVPGMSYSIRELLERATRGQRLNVHMYPSEVIPDGVPSEMVDEPFDGDNVPVLHDLVDYDDFSQSVEQNRTKREAERQAERENAKTARDSSDADSKSPEEPKL